jgi:predicted NUDIX family NTP pyrophosphohydrolase
MSDVRGIVFIMNTHKKTKRIKKHAFGILLYRTDSLTGELNVFLAQANGPRYWFPSRTQIWGLPKGRGETGETEFESAAREFEEEVGMPLPPLKFKKMMDHHRTDARQMITVFKGNANKFDINYVSSNHQTREWPESSGNVVSYPEISTARWFPLDQAMKVVLPGQREILKQFSKDHARKAYKKAMKRKVKLETVKELAGMRY